jgi:hypothetical protein
MATTTPNFGWAVPTSTDLVKDGAVAIETLGDSIDASLVDLKGGTTGQVLSKASNTDMDFTWVTDAAGDITGVTAGTGISGGGTSGTVTVTNSMATAITTAGDLIKGTGAGTFNRLGIGTAGQVLQVNSGATAPEWATPSSGGGMTLLSTTTLSGSTTSVTGISSAYVDLVIYVENAGLQTSSGVLSANVNTATTNGFFTSFKSDNTTARNTTNGNIPLSYGESCDTGVSGNSFTITIHNYANTSSRKPTTWSGNYYASGWKGIWGGGGFERQDATSSFQLITSAGTFNAGTIKIYGVK